MLYWGIVATLIWHYTVDASLVGLLLIRSDNWYFKISGLVVALAAVAPLVYCGVLYLARGQFEDVEDLRNDAQPMPEINLSREPTPQQVAASARRYEALTTGTLGFLVACVVIGAVLAIKLERDHIGDYLKVAADRSMAMQRADAVMRNHGLNPSTYRRTAIMVDTTDPAVNEFLWRRMSIAQINQIYEYRVPGDLWRVRYFRDSQPEEFRVSLKPDGSPHGFWHILPEEAKGANLTKEEAVAIAARYLQEQKHIDLTSWGLKEENSDKHPNRTDTTLTWELKTPLDSATPAGNNPADHAYERMSVTVLGDEPVDFRTFVKIPDEFERDLGKQTVARILVSVGRICLSLALVVSVFVFFFKRLRAQPPVRTPWRRFFGWGILSFVAVAVGFSLGRGIPGIMDGYPTSIPFRIFLATAAIGMFLFGALLLGVVTLLFGLAYSFAARAFGEDHLPDWLGMPASYYRDAFWIALGGTGVLVGFRHLMGYLVGWWPTLHRGIPASFGQSYDMMVPAAGIIGTVIFRSLLMLGILLLAGAFIGAELRLRWLRLALFFALAVGMVFSWGSPADFLKQFLVSVISLGVVVFGICRIVRFNLLGLFLVVACNLLLGGAGELVTQPNLFYRANGYAILLAIALLLVWPLILWRTNATVADGRSGTTLEQPPASNAVR
jgi:hypothetical protein